MTNRIGSDRRLLSDRRYCGVESSGQPTPFHGLGMLHVFALLSISGNDITPVIYLDWLELSLREPRPNAVRIHRPGKLAFTNPGGATAIPIGS